MLSPLAVVLMPMVVIVPPLPVVLLVAVSVPLLAVVLVPLVAVLLPLLLAVVVVPFARLQAQYGGLNQLAKNRQVSPRCSTWFSGCSSSSGHKGARTPPTRNLPETAVLPLAVVLLLPVAVVLPVAVLLPPLAVLPAPPLGVVLAHVARSQQRPAALEAAPSEASMPLTVTPLSVAGVHHLTPPLAAVVTA